MKSDAESTVSDQWVDDIIITLCATKYDIYMSTYLGKFSAISGRLREVWES